MTSPLCAHCHRLRPTAPRARFCSGRCRARAYRRRKQGVAEDAPPISEGNNATGVTLADYYGPPGQRHASAAGPARPREED